MNRFMQRYFELEKELPVKPKKRKVILFIMDYCLKESMKLDGKIYVIAKSKL